MALKGLCAKFYICMALWIIGSPCNVGKVNKDHNHPVAQDLPEINLILNYWLNFYFIFHYGIKKKKTKE